AHHLTGIALLAAAIVRQVDEDPAAAKASAGQVREQSRTVLTDLRRLVTLLREDADAPRPVETVAALTALVEDRCATGAAIGLTVTEPVAQRAVDVGPLGQLVVHRMVQESLSNAAAHAPGAPCTVEVRTSEDQGLVVLVRNAAVAAPRAGSRGEHRSGFGLMGMAERAQLVGGSLTYGPTGAGGWFVRLVVPFDEAPTPSTTTGTVRSAQN
ncbi:MAG: hypothetical protein EOP01_02315, partial [Propionibacteriaceae bacterium]